MPDTSEHLVAIVSFEGALKREIKRLREELRKCEDLPHFHFRIEAEGRVHEGEVKLKFGIGEYTSIVEGDSLTPIVDEFLRRHGWQTIHNPKALTYEKIPGDNTDEE